MQSFLRNTKLCTYSQTYIRRCTCKTHTYGDCNCNNKIKTITLLVNNGNEMLKHYTRFFYSSGSLRILCLSCKLK